jgi:monoamine oxidase
MELSRRAFILGLAAVAGPTAALAAAHTLVPPATTAEPTLLRGRVRQAPADLGEGRSVVIVGAGIAGMVAAYELTRMGFAVTVLEAGDRVGGRILTLRAGDTVRYADGTVQHVDYAPDLYFNAGAARIPSTHRAVLGYCRELGVPMEIVSLISRSALAVVNDKGEDRRYTVGQLQGDARGYLSEMLAKCAQQGTLDARLDAGDSEKLLGLLRDFGDLTREHRYAGSRRSGYAIPPAAGDVSGTLRKTLDFRVLLDHRLWYPLWYDEHLEYQPTMMQPVGGMDAISMAFARVLGDRVIRQAPVTDIHIGDQGVQVAYRRGSERAATRVSADYAIVTCQLPALLRIANNLPRAFLDAAASVSYRPVFKIGWQSPRFWEEDCDIYGGISFLDDDTSLVWYPSSGFFAPRGLLVGGYTHGPPAVRYADLSLPAQQAASRRSIDRLHPGQSGKLSHPVSVAWHKLPYSEGGWADWHEPMGPAYETLIAPQGPCYFAGEHLSHLPGWMEGSVQSALRAVDEMARRAAR